jgi:hypothetical protein
VLKKYLRYHLECSDGNVQLAGSSGVVSLLMENLPPHFGSSIAAIFAIYTSQPD